MYTGEIVRNMTFPSPELVFKLKDEVLYKSFKKEEEELHMKYYSLLQGKPADIRSEVNDVVCSNPE